jgi:hypothetical protein
MFIGAHAPVILETFLEGEEGIFLPRSHLQAPRPEWQAFIS